MKQADQRAKGVPDFRRRGSGSDSKLLVKRNFVGAMRRDHKK
jgi:hypothetical protein